MNLSGDVTGSCTSVIPGAAGIWVTARDQIASYELNADTSISAITLVSGSSGFYRIGFVDETGKAMFSSVANGRGRAVGYEIDITAFNEGDSLTKDARMRELKKDSPCGLVVFVRDNDGLERIFGIGNRPDVATTATITFTADEPGKVVLGTDNQDSGDGLETDKQTEIHFVGKVAHRPRIWSGATDPTGIDAT